jgi:2-aminoethylphosphonate-pyruvate transaminase
MILLNPGPVTLSPRVRSSLLREDLCHREPEFAQMILEIRARLEAIYPSSKASYAAVLLTSSGTGAVEAMLCTFAPRDTATLIVSNGVYGERMAIMLERQGKPHVSVSSPWTEPLNLNEVATALDSHPEITRIAVVHHETTTGRLNRLDDLASMCITRNVKLLIDAVSSFGGEDIPLDRWRPLAVAGTANKCLHGVPGISFVLSERDALARNQGFATALYLDLSHYYHAQVEGWSPYTQTVQGCFALQEALEEFHEAGGWRARHLRYRELSQQLRHELDRLKVDALLTESETSAILTAYRIPEGDSYQRIHDALKSRGFIIYAGQGDLQRTIFRIAHMGAINDEDLKRLIAALQITFSANKNHDR